MNTEELLVFPNLEIGDQIVLNGACRVLARREKAVAWAARHDNISAVTKMFSDLPNVRTFLVNEYNYPVEYAKLGQEWERQIRIGYFSEAGVLWNSATSGNWDQKFYEDAGINFEERWKSFSLPPHMLIGMNSMERGNFALVHESPDRKYTIDRDLLPARIVKVEIHDRIDFWSWLPFLVCASELHFIDSCFLNLAESLYAIGLLRETKLVFHYYSKARIHHRSKAPVLKGPWKIL